MNKVMGYILLAIIDHPVITMSLLALAVGMTIRNIMKDKKDE